MNTSRSAGTSLRPTHLFRPALERDRMQALLTEGDLIVSDAEESEGGVAANLIRDESGLRLAFLTSEAELHVQELSEAVRFLPKVTWRLPHTDMLLTGFRSGRWHGLGLYASEGKQLVSYLDYSVKLEGQEIEIGFCMTHPEWRSRGLVKRLLASLLLLYFDHTFRISTHESNLAMSRALEHFGFTVNARLPRDRINGETTLYLIRKAASPFTLAEPN